VANHCPPSAQTQAERREKDETLFRSRKERRLKGIRISAEKLEKYELCMINKVIFSPFFTTRSEGSGLGLALCKKYIEVLGGKIEVTTQLGIGTTFVIYLPKTIDK
jgi:chemotaxis protein histidine kinase CheA